MTCAHAVSVAIKKIPGVASVEVTLKRGHAEVQLQPGNGVRIEQLWEAVRKQGLTPKATGVVVRGTLNGTKLAVPPSGATYEVSGRTGHGESIEVYGTMSPPPKNVKPTLVVSTPPTP
jgi:copper chaperone CopZ